MNIETGSRLRPSEVELLGTFLSESYGKYYQPGKAERLLASGDRFLLGRTKIGRLAAVTVLNGPRIAMLAALGGIDGLSRRERGLEIAEACHQDGVGAWTSVGEQHINHIGAFFRLAGMSRIGDPAVARTILEPINPYSPPVLDRDDNGSLVAVSTAYSHVPGYRQALYAWEDRLAS